MSSMRILVVEDETGLANSLVAGLKEETYAVDHAADGETGEFLAETNDYDVIVLDVMLPKLDGFQVCRDLRSRESACRRLRPAIRAGSHAAPGHRG